MVDFDFISKKWVHKIITVTSVAELIISENSNHIKYGSTLNSFIDRVLDSKLPGFKSTSKRSIVNYRDEIKMLIGLGAIDNVKPMADYSNNKSGHFIVITKLHIN